MRAELVLLGRRLDMASKSHRQSLVVTIYVGLGLLMTSFWFMDRWRVTGVYMIFATSVVNRLLLGGYQSGGLIKPFSGKLPSRVQPVPLLALGLRLYPPEPEERDYRNDEREIQQRDRVHYQAYQILCILLVLVWGISDWLAMAPRLLAWVPFNSSLLLYGLVLAAIVFSQTLPQAILLWSEPDLEKTDA